MADGPTKFLNFLDQLLPFLAACPPWLRIWVHVLILLNFVTIAGLAVYYLSSKESAMEDQSLKHFSIESPGNNQEIPLGDDGTWRVSGILPKAKGADIDLQVSKLPGRQTIVQTAPQKTVSTYDGHWWFDSVKFEGYGSYEITATGSLGGENRVASVTVKCSDKGTAYKLSIEREKKFRPTANVMTLPEGAVPVEEVLRQYNQLQDQFIDLYFNKQPLNNDDLQHALELVNQTLDLLDEVLPLKPDDLNLQAARAFFLKNYAMVTRDLQRPDEANLALSEAQFMFEALVRQQPQDTNGWNGLGSVFALRGHQQEALVYIQKAVDLAPDNPYAQRDLENIKQRLMQQTAAAK